MKSALCLTSGSLHQKHTTFPHVKQSGKNLWTFQLTEEVRTKHIRPVRISLRIA